MDHDDDGETSYNTFVDDVAFEPTYLQTLLTAAGRNVATVTFRQQDHCWVLHDDVRVELPVGLLTFSLENPANIRINFILPETRLLKSVVTVHVN